MTRVTSRPRIRSAASIDRMLWDRGVNQWNVDPINASTRVPHELDYLRGLHSRRTLAQLQLWIASRTRKPVRLRAMWQDKSTYVRPYRRSRALAVRELADIAVLVRSGIARPRQWMWILQAKVLKDPCTPFAGVSSAREIELFEQDLEFELLDGRKGGPISTRFDSSTFAKPQAWSFLTFHRDPNAPSPQPYGPYPVRHRWPGSANPVPPTHSSFAEALCKLVVNPGRAFGTEVLAPGANHWSDLYYALMHAAARRPTTGFARSVHNPNGSVLQFATAALAYEQMWSQPRLLVSRAYSLYRRGLGHGWQFETPSLNTHLTDAFHRFDHELFEFAGLLNAGQDGDNDEPPEEGDGQGGRSVPGPGLPFILFVDIADDEFATQLPPGPGVEVLR